MDTRTDEQKIRGILPVRWGGELREVPTLKRGASRIWRERLPGALTAVGTVNVDGFASFASLGNLAGDTMLDLILEYDQSRVLGDREWIDAHVDDEEIYAAFRGMLEVAYPFVGDVRGILAEIRGMGLFSPSPLPTSTSTPSPSGDSRRKK